MEFIPFPSDNSILEKVEVEEAFNLLRLNRLGGTSGVRAENLCQWLQEVKQDKYPDATN